jgi:osmotically-inducible protein OsmY
MRYIIGTGALAGAALALAGCNQQQKVEANSASQKAKNQIEQATATAKHDLTDGTITLKVKSAMNSSDKLNTSAVNVDTKDKVVHLRGAVPSADQKALAERIAKDTVGQDVKVVNELAVSPPTSGSVKQSNSATKR